MNEDYMESLTPNIFVRDIDAAVAFYELIGFSKIMTVPDAPPFVWVMLKCGAVTMMLQSMESLGSDLPEIDRARSGGGLLFYINVKAIHDFFESIREKVTVVKGLEKTFYGATEFTIADPDGFLLTFAEHE
jgi:uncharacterized glyoxalase superfamily protein PhnB